VRGSQKLICPLWWKYIESAPKLDFQNSARKQARTRARARTHACTHQTAEMSRFVAGLFSRSLITGLSVHTGIASLLSTRAQRRPLPNNDADASVVARWRRQPQRRRLGAMQNLCAGILFCCWTAAVFGARACSGSRRAGTACARGCAARETRTQTVQTPGAARRRAPSCKAGHSSFSGAA